MGNDSADTEYIDSYDDVSSFSLETGRERRLHEAQTECTFMWTDDRGGPVGVIMNYVAHDDRFWVTCTRRRRRVAAVIARPQVAIAMSSRGTAIGVSQSVTYTGTAIVHDDEPTKAWLYGALARKVRPGNEQQQAAFIAHLDTPGRVVIEIVPRGRIGFDAERMFAGSPAGTTRTQV